MSKKKVEKRKLYDSDGFVLQYNEIRKAVNTFDKEFGISLKDPEIWDDPETYYKVVLEKARINLSAVLCLVNGILISDYFDTECLGQAMPVRSIGTNHPVFVEDSMLQWDKENIRYDVNSLLFRARFVSNVIQSFLFNTNKIISNNVKNCKHSFDENKIIILKNDINYLIKFTNIMLNPNTPYQNIILKVNEIMSYRYKRINNKKLKNNLGSLVIYTRKSMQDNFITEKFYSDDMAINELLKISYTLATNSYDYSVLPSFKHIEGATVKHDLIRLIEELGVQIIKYNGTKKAPNMFLSFIKANPSIMTQYHKECNENLAIATGISALSYTKFIMNDKTVGKFIDNMMMKGI